MCFPVPHPAIRTFGLLNLSFDSILFGFIWLLIITKGLEGDFL